MHSTDRTTLTPSRTFKLVPYVWFVAELAVNFAIPLGKGRVLFIGLSNGVDLLLADFVRLLA